MSEIIKVKNPRNRLSVTLRDYFTDKKSDENTVEKLIEEQSRIIEQQKKEYEQKIEDSFNEGVREGYGKAKEELEKKYAKQLEERVKELAGIFGGMEDVINEYESEFEKVVLDTSFLIAKQVIKREIEQETTISHMLAASLKKIIGANDVIVKLNGEDLATLRELDQATYNGDAFSKVTFEADDRIEKGGCFIETDIGNVDSRISTQIKEIEKLVTERTNNEPDINADGS